MGIEAYPPVSDYLVTTVPVQNYLHNGSFAVWQRSTTAAGTGYRADRWYALSGLGASLEVTAVTGSGDSAVMDLGFQNACRIQRSGMSTATSSAAIIQALESKNCAPLRGKTVTLSYWARKGHDYSQASSQMSAYIYTGTGTDQSAADPVGWTGTAQPLAGGTSTLTESFQRFSHTVALGSTITQVAVRLHVSAWVGTATYMDYIDIAGVQLEVGATANPFQFKPYDQELRECQRYYYAEGQVSAIHHSFNQGNTNSSAMMFPVTMRAVPVIAVTDLSGNVNKVNWSANGGSSTANTAEPAKSIFTSHWRYAAGGMPTSSDGMSWFSYTASAEI